MKKLIKICGLSTPDTLESAIEAGADLVGFVRFPKSPRHVEIAQGTELALQAKGRVSRVVLTVDAPDAELDEIMHRIAPDILQFHGNETPQRVEEIRSRYGIPIFKALGIGSAGDLAAITLFQGIADTILLDAKPAPDALLPGGNGKAFDWQLLTGIDPAVSFMLSGGLNPDNIAEAIQITGASSVDVSSGVERTKGAKDGDLIRAFIHNARAAWNTH